MSDINYSKLRILIVDDFNEMRRTLRRMLEGFGVTRIMEAPNARETLATIATEQFDVIFCDYNLGDGKNGQQILEEVKHRKLIRPDTAFIMVTAEVGQDMVLSAVEYKPDDYLTKPFVAGVLQKRIEKVMLRKQRLAKIDSAMARGAYREAVELCDEQLADAPRNRFDLLQLKGEALLLLNENGLARMLYSEIVDQRPLPWATFGLARVEENLGNYAEACRIYEQVLEQNKLFMETYDRLATCHTKLGNSKHAQEMLSQAIKLSPRQLKRQRELGRVAHDNGDFETAGQAMRRAIKLGEHSYLKSMDDYTGLARTMAASGEGEGALKIIDSARKEFKGRSDLEMQTALAESIVHQKMGNSEMARQALESAGIKEDLASTEVPVDITIDLARGHLQRDERGEALDILRSLLKNFNEDPAIVIKIEKLFDEFGLQAEYSSLMSAVQSEISELNNKGVALVKEGKLDEAIELFHNASTRLPKNKTVNLNTAQVLIMKMKQSGADPRYLHQTHGLLERVRASEPGNEKLVTLTAMYNELNP